MLNDQYICGDDYAPKARKPYTITKQRERWTEEEHKKFLEALKLYGRAWRRIEEHVGTKTAIQIRSHAQKFFSKVVRESSGGDVDSVKPIEIPPPRPKRKPKHPYPRKVASPPKNGTHFPEGQRRSMSPNSMDSERENQSPTSVLPTIGSEMLGGADFGTPNGSLSPVSSGDGSKPGESLPYELNTSPDENGSSSLDQENRSLDPDVQVPMKLEEFPQENDSAQVSAEASSAQCLKLFGKTVLVTDSHSLPSAGTFKSQPQEPIDEIPVQVLPCNIMPKAECGWNPLPIGALPALYYMQLPNENRDPMEAGSAPIPWWALYGGVPFPLMQLHNTVPVKSQPLDGNEAQNQETGSANVEDFEMQSERDDEPKVMFGVSPGKCIKGFVPYKRCLEERESNTLTMGGEEREEQRIRLCL